MRYKIRLASLLLCGFAVLFGIEEGALGRVIDDFDVDNLDVLKVDNDNGDATNPQTDSTTGTGASSSILGTERETEITATGGTPETSEADVYAGSATISNGPGANSTTTFTWDGVGTPAGGFGDTDLTDRGADAFEIDVLFLDHGPPSHTVNFQLDVFDGTDTAQLIQSVTSAATPDPYSTVVKFLFSSFTPSGSWDNATSFESVNKIVLTITGTPAFDLEFDNFETNPEPSTFALLGVVCVGLGIYHRRRRKLSAASHGDDADNDSDDSPTMAPSHE